MAARTDNVDQLRSSLGHPVGGFFFARDFFTAAFQFPSIFNGDGLVPRFTRVLDFGAQNSVPSKDSSGAGDGICTRNPVRELASKASASADFATPAH